MAVLTKPKRAATTARSGTKSKTKTSAKASAPRTRTLEGDLFGAAGGAPFAPSGATGIDRSSSSSNRRGATKELSWAEFDTQVQLLARQSAKQFKPTAVVGIAHGGVFVGGAIASALKVDFFPVRITRRSRDSGSRATAGLSDNMPKELKGQRVLLVDDVAGSGDGLEMARRLAQAAGASKLATAALISRPNGFTPDFVAFTSDTFFVFPWDYQELVDDARFDPDTAGA